MLRYAAPLPRELSHVGVRAHSLRPAEGPGENRLLCRVERVVEEVFSTVVMLSTPGGDRGFSRLRLELDKEDWAALGSPAALALRVEPEDILLLTEPKS